MLPLKQRQLQERSPNVLAWVWPILFYSCRVEVFRVLGFCLASFFFFGIFHDPSPHERTQTRRGPGDPALLTTPRPPNRHCIILSGTPFTSVRYHTGMNLSQRKNTALNRPPAIFNRHYCGITTAVVSPPLPLRHGLARAPGALSLICYCCCRSSRVILTKELA